jgi:hypothetical protein
MKHLTTGRIVPFRKSQSPEQLNRHRAGGAADRMLLVSVLEAAALGHQFARNRAALIRCAKRRSA